MSAHQRKQEDRRAAPSGPWGALPPAGRRMRARRASERRRPYFVDRFSAGMFALVFLILLGSVADALLTIHLLANGAEEINPCMDRLLRQGIFPFLVTKYALTTIGLPLLLIFKNYYLFGTGVRVGHLLPAIVVLYLLLIGYQIVIMLASAEPLLAGAG
jgi:hypothetical protein